MALKNKGANRNENADFVTLRLVWQVDRNSLSLCTHRDLMGQYRLLILQVTEKGNFVVF